MRNPERYPRPAERKNFPDKVFVIGQLDVDYEVYDEDYEDRRTRHQPVKTYLTSFASLKEVQDDVKFSSESEEPVQIAVYKLVSFGTIKQTVEFIEDTGGA